MKKNTLILLTLCCVFLMGSTIKDKNLPVIVGDVAPKVFNLEISWDSMNFTYQEIVNYVWDNDTKTYELSKSTYKWTTSTNIIEIENKTNIPVNIELKYLSENKNINGSFDIPQKTINKNEQLISKLNLEGTLETKYTSYTKIGTINLIIS